MPTNAQREPLEEVVNGQYFLHEGQLYIRADLDESYAVNACTGRECLDDGDLLVQAVNVVINVTHT